MLTRFLAIALLASSLPASALLAYSDSGDRLSSALCTGSTLDAQAAVDLPGADRVSEVLHTISGRVPDFYAQASRSIYDLQVTYVCGDLAGDEFPGLKTTAGRVSVQIGNHLYISVARFNELGGSEAQARLILQAVLTDLLQGRVDQKKAVLTVEQIDQRAKMAAAKLIGFDRRVREIGVRVRRSELPNLLQEAGLMDLGLTSSAN